MLAPRLLPGEEIVTVGAAWFVDTPRTRLLFAGRHYRFVALTDRRLLVFRRRRNRGRHGAGPLLDTPLDSLRLRRAGGARLVYPVVLEAGSDRTVALEFRIKERSVGHALASACRGTPAAH
jgi:hypothetical protein